MMTDMISKTLYRHIYKQDPEIGVCRAISYDPQTHYGVWYALVELPDGSFKSWDIVTSDKMVATRLWIYRDKEVMPSP